jgi:putative addiction module killer protein
MYAISYVWNSLFIMEKWILEYWVDDSGKRSVERWLLKLTHEQFKAVSKELKLLESCGNGLKLPHSKALGKGLFELREQRYGYRIYYGFYLSKIIILLHAGDKSKQENDIKIARTRLTKTQGS